MLSQSEVEKQILAAQEIYYNRESNGDMISDYEYDRMVDYLKSIAPDSPVLKVIGRDKSDGRNKSDHIFPVMGSQNKASTDDEFQTWLNRHCKKNSNGLNSAYTVIVEPKLDGASIELVFKGGIFTKAVTRGDGRIGDIITQNASKMSGLKPRISTKFDGAIRGEVILPRSVFLNKYSDKKNPRNCAVGLMKRLDCAGSEDLVIIVYDLYDTKNPENNLNEIKKLRTLEGFGLNVVPYEVINASDRNGVFEAVWDRRTLYMKDRESVNRTLDYDYDGIVVKNEIQPADDLTRDRPNSQIAVKFDFDEKETVITGVEWSVSGKHRTPVALLEPVQLCGTTVSRASLANPRILKELGLKIGSKITVVKRGEIIPKVISVDKTFVTKNQKEIQIPVKCEFCGTTLMNEDSGLYCPNPDCSEVRIHRIEKWISTHGIQHIGRQTLNYYIKAGVEQIADLYLIEHSDLVKAGLGDAMAAKTIVEINNKSTVTTIPKFLAGFDLDGIGESTIEKIVKHYKAKRVEDVFELTFLNLIAVPGIGETTALDLMRNIEYLKDEMTEALKYVEIESDKTNGGSLSNKTFVFTGKLTGLTRDQAVALVKFNGGSATSVVSNGTNYVVTDSPDTDSAKAQKARKLGIPIISSKAFRSMINNGGK
jgi:DNA ligase (NAD+)